MSIDFPYEKKYIDEGELIDPRIVVEIKTVRGFLAIKFLVDSGADVTSLPLDPYGELFCYQINPKEKVTIGGVEGRGVGGYPFKLQCRLERFTFSLRCYFLESKIDPLLGRLDFWNLFAIFFDNKKFQTSVSSIK